MTISQEIRERLLELRDEAYGDFQRRLIPNISGESIIGVRTPDIKKLAKEMARREDAQGFLEELPHSYFEENQVHAFMIAEERDFECCLQQVERFLPYVDNWETCDQLSPKAFARHPMQLLSEIPNWLDSGKTYTVRFGIGQLMCYFLDERFDPRYLEMAAGVQSEEYYIQMMVAWYFATALAKQYDAAWPYIRDRRLSRWVHNKTIQKAVESNRITDDQKAELKAQRIK